MKIFITTSLLLICLFSFSQQQYHRARILLGQQSIMQLAETGIAVDHIDMEGDAVVSDFSDWELQTARAAGFKTEILIHNVADYYARQSPGVKSSEGNPGCQKTFLTKYKTPDNFKLGSMGGYNTLDELMKTLDSMVAKFPNLISTRQIIDTTKTWEGRQLYFVKISDNPNVDESETEILYTALHHAREPNSMMQLLYYMWYLLENYQNDAEVKRLVDNLEMYFVPCINPDGYIYNQITNPSGGGMWRKNRRLNSGGQYGVDLNRNYGVNWGFNNSGSSPSTASETYRGPSAFSEPETRAIRNFCNKHSFSQALNYHTFSNVIIYPNGHVPVGYTPDSNNYINLARHITEENGYTFGTCFEVLAYVANGGSDDWMYGEQISKPKILAMTPEVGPTHYGFWPPQNEIINLCNANINQNIRFAQAALPYAFAQDLSHSFVSGSGYLPFRITQLGNDLVNDIKVSLVSLSPLASTSGPKIFPSSSLNNFILVDSISYSLSATPPLNTPIRFVLKVEKGSSVFTDTLTKYFGNPVQLFSNTGMPNNWSSTLWDSTSSKFYSPPVSYTDSRAGTYPSNASNMAETSNWIDLRNAVNATADFWLSYEIEVNYDEFTVLAVDESSTTYRLCGKYSTLANASSMPVYQGKSMGWLRESISLADVLGKRVKLQLIMESDNGQNRDGVYIDDFEVKALLTPIASIQNQNGNEMKVFPVPASNKICITGLPKINQSFVSVCDITGRQYQLPAWNKSQQLEVDTDVLPNGIYTLQIQPDQGFSSSLRFVIYR